MDLYNIVFNLMFNIIAPTSLMHNLVKFGVISAEPLQKLKQKLTDCNNFISEVSMNLSFSLVWMAGIGNPYFANAAAFNLKI